MKTVKILIAGASIAMSQPAYADWQYTRWGMSPAEVAAASEGQANLSGGESGQQVSGYDIGAVGTYKAGEYNFNSTFYFKNNKLSLVKLELMGNDVSGLKGAIDGLYGKTFDQSVSPVHGVYIYHDREKNNRVDLLIIGYKSASLSYRPLVNSNASGL